MFFSQLLKYKTFQLLMLFLVLDISQVNHIWGENFHRRSLHHFQRNTYNPRRTPWIHEISNGISPNTINYINDITQDINKTNCLMTSVVSAWVGGQYSSRCTLYYNDFPPDVQNKLDEIGRDMIPKFQQYLPENTSLHLSNSDFRCILLRYEGNYSQFGMHYNTEPQNNYRTLFLIKKEGNVPTFKYENNHNTKYVNMSLGDGIFQMGTRTYHGIHPAKDPDTVRHVIGWQYTTDSLLIDNNFYSKLQSESIWKVFTTCFQYLMLTYVLSQFIINSAPYEKNERYRTEIKVRLILLTLCTIWIASCLPQFLPEHMGTHIITEMHVAVIYLGICWVSTFDWHATLVLFNYIILSEMFLPRQMVNYHLERIGF
jgi:hypothetical protein